MLRKHDKSIQFPQISRFDARTIANKLKSGNPAILVMDQNATNGELGFELVQSNQDELAIILKRLTEILG